MEESGGVVARAHFEWMLRRESEAIQRDKGANAMRHKQRAGSCMTKHMIVWTLFTR